MSGNLGRRTSNTATYTTGSHENSSVVNDPSGPTAWAGERPKQQEIVVRRVQKFSLGCSDDARERETLLEDGWRLMHVVDLHPRGDSMSRVAEYYTR